MTISNTLYKLPKDIPLKNTDLYIDLIVHGQGVFIFRYNDAYSPCVFLLHNKKSEPEGLKIELTKYAVNINRLPRNEPLIDEKNNQGLSNKNGAYYWLSVDSHNQRIYVGIGEPRRETHIYSYQFPVNDKTIFKKNREFLESLVTISIPNESYSLKSLKLLRDPITFNVPLIVKNTDELTMNDVALGAVMPKPNLSVTCQKLFDCVAGKKFVLDDKDFPDFSKAIEYSIVTPGCWCNKTLINKSTEFGNDPKETYLRITLGQNNGESPGIPYVMEIWPIGHYSPVHNHAGANAIIRVLHGSINVSLYAFLSQDKIFPFADKTLKKNDITWISPTLNQIHQLKNFESNTETCITIQCYMYDDDNKKHYDYFDYLDENTKKQQYDPDSDMDFVKFKHTMRLEWDNRSVSDIMKSCFTRN